jgi:hypothetical protein
MGNKTTSIEERLMKKMWLTLGFILMLGGSIGCQGDPEVVGMQAPKESLEAQSVYGWEAWLLAFGEEPMVELFESDKFYVLYDGYKSIEVHPFGTYPEGHWWKPTGLTGEEDRDFEEAYRRTTNGRMGL